MSKYVKFIGSFKDLIPNGWTFQKLFAANYRQYHKTCDGEQYSQGCRIWQHSGGYLEIDDLFAASALIVEKIADETIEEWKHVSRSIFRPEEMHIMYPLLFDRKENRFICRYSEEGNRIRYTDFDQFKLFEAKKISQKKYNTHVDRYCNRYREFTLRPKTVAMIKDLLDKGWIEVAEDKRAAK